MAKAEAPQRTQAATEYVILKQEQTATGASAWVEAGAAQHATRDGAVQQVVGDREGKWKAVPARSWKQTISTRTEQITKTRLEVVEDQG